MVAGLELCHLGPDRLHHPGAVGLGNAAIGRRQPSRHHAQIVEVQRSGMDAHADGVRPGIIGVGKIHERQTIEPLLRMNLDRLHADAPRLREGSHCRMVAANETTRTAPR